VGGEAALDDSSSRRYDLQMEDYWRPEFAEAISFSRLSIAQVLDVAPRRLNNWIDRNQLWQERSGLSKRAQRYRLREVFDLAGFSAMRTAHIPEQDCARYVRNYGFYRGFLHGDQMVDFSYRNDKWDIGLYDPSAIVSVRINLRTIGERIFRRVSQLLSEDPSDRATEDLKCFKQLYQRAVELDRLRPDSAPIFEVGSK
jgi:hypothetical protein